MIQLKVRPEHLRGTQPPPERRRYKRVEVVLLGRFMRVLTRDEYTCRLVNISIGGASVLSDAAPLEGEPVVIYFDELGGLEGTVRRSVPGGFAIDFNATHRRRQKLAAQITWLLNRHELEPAEQRRSGHERVNVAPRPVTLTFEDGSTSDHDILDVSVSGASISIGKRPPLGSTVTVGRLPSKVVRHHGGGIGVEFIRVQPFDAIREDFG